MKTQTAAEHRKKVCLIVGSPLSIQFFLVDQIAILAKSYDVTVITNSAPPDLFKKVSDPLRVLHVEMERQVSPWKDLKALFGLIRILRKEQFDLVHTLSPKAGLLGHLASWIVQVPRRLHTFQGEVWITRKGLWREFLKFLDKIVVATTTHLLVVSKSERQFLHDQNVVQMDRLKILGNGSICGVNIEKFKPSEETRLQVREEVGIPSNETVILYVGRKNEDKGLIDLVDAFKLLSVKNSQIHLLVVGPDEQNMEEKMLQRAGAIKSRIHFVGFTKSSERYMAASDILCLPSYREGFGMVLIEAAACGLATVASRIYGIVDAVVEDETGLLFKAGDVRDLADKLQRIIDNPVLRENFGRLGKERVHNDFSMQLVQREWLKFYDQIL